MSISFYKNNLVRSSLAGLDKSRKAFTEIIKVANILKAIYGDKIIEYSPDFSRSVVGVSELDNLFRGGDIRTTKTGPHDIAAFENYILATAIRSSNIVTAYGVLDEPRQYKRILGSAYYNKSVSFVRADPDEDKIHSVYSYSPSKVEHIKPIVFTENACSVCKIKIKRGAIACSNCWKHRRSEIPVKSGL